MKRPTVRTPSPAMIVALISLVVAMAGTTYAAIKLPKNSIGGKQLKKNSVSGAKIKKDSVTGAKVKDQSLTGKDINLAQLGTVPSAQLANSIPPAEATHLVGAPGEPGFENGSSNLGAIGPTAVRPVGFYKDHEGIVHLQGFAKVGESGPIGTIFSLPPGYRPANGLVAAFIQFCSPVGGGECETDSEGDESGLGSVAVTGANVAIGPGVILNGAVVALEGVGVSLDGITFRAEG
jgi:hypothetical protein